jgi:hypothetical protein
VSALQTGIGVFVLGISMWAAVAASRSAAHGREAVTEMRDTAKRQLRAYLYVVNHKTPDLSAETPQALFFLKNAGQTPAMDVAHAAGTAIGEYPFKSDPPAIPDNLFARSSVLVTGNTFILSHHLTEALSGSKIQDIKAGRKMFVMYGEVRYKDIYGDAHFVKYRSMYGGPPLGTTDNIVWCESGNEAN